MTAMWKKFSGKHDKLIAGWPEDAIADYIDHIYDDIAMLRDESPQLLRHAHCMIVYGTFENSIGSLCRVVHLDGKITKPLPNSLHMSDVKGYLRPHIKTQPTPFAKDWDWMDEFRIIRNWMAHNGGKVQQDGDNWVNAKKFRRRNRGLIKFARFDEIIVEEELVDRALEKATRATTTIEKAVECLYVKPK
jgi:hypothetical protein